MVNNESALKKLIVKYGEQAAQLEHASKVLKAASDRMKEGKRNEQHDNND